MKYTNCLFLVWLLVIAPGCVLNRQVVLDIPVGPHQQAEQSNSPGGRLVVYSGLDIGGGESGYDQNHHSDYRIYSLDGKLLKYVSNKVSAITEDPATVSLPPGKYNAVAKAAAFGMVTVPIVIKAGKTTFVHLDGSELTGGQQTPTNDFVCLPDGLVIGWRAEENGDPQ